MNWPRRVKDGLIGPQGRGETKERVGLQSEENIAAGEFGDCWGQSQLWTKNGLSEGAKG